MQSRNHELELPPKNQEREIKSLNIGNSNEGSQKSRQNNQHL